jgi:hypothetical protein
MHWQACRDHPGGPANRRGRRFNGMTRSRAASESVRVQRQPARPGRLSTSTRQEDTSTASGTNEAQHWQPPDPHRRLTGRQQRSRATGSGAKERVLRSRTSALSDSDLPVARGGVFNAISGQAQWPCPPVPRASIAQLAVLAEANHPALKVGDLTEVDGVRTTSNFAELEATLNLKAGGPASVPAGVWYTLQSAERKSRTRY